MQTDETVTITLPHVDSQEAAVWARIGHQLAGQKISPVAPPPLSQPYLITKAITPPDYGRDPLIEMRRLVDLDISAFVQPTLATVSWDSIQRLMDAATDHGLKMTCVFAHAAQDTILPARLAGGGWDFGPLGEFARRFGAHPALLYIWFLDEPPRHGFNTYDVSSMNRAMRRLIPPEVKTVVQYSGYIRTGRIVFRADHCSLVHVQKLPAQRQNGVKKWLWHEFTETQRVTQQKVQALVPGMTFIRGLQQFGSEAADAPYWPPTPEKFEQQFQLLLSLRDTQAIWLQNWMSWVGFRAGDLGHDSSQAQRNILATYTAAVD